MATTLEKLIASVIPSQNIVVGGKTVKQSAGIPVDVRISLDPEFGKTLVKGAAFLSFGIAVGMIGREVVRKSK